MTTENGAATGDVENVNSQATADVSSGGDSANTATDAELAKKELASRDAKIAELMKREKESQDALLAIKAQQEQEELSKKSTEEQLQHMNAKLAEMERERLLAVELADSPVSVAQAKEIMSGDVENGTKVLKNIIEQSVADARRMAVEEFKKESLGNVSKEAPQTQSAPESSLLSGFKAGANIT